MTICYFGIYDREYNRNRVIIKGLKENGVKVIECNTELKGVKKYFDLINKHRKLRKKYDLMIVGFPAAHSTIVARFITGKPIVSDIFVSHYDTLVFDRKNYRPKSLMAKYLWLLDWLACKFATRLLLDTEEHIKYFVKTFKTAREKFIRVFIGADDEVFKKAGSVQNEIFQVVFHGTFIPVQGAIYIVRAAKILREHKDIRFIFIGKGRDYNLCVDYADKHSLSNVEFKGYVPYLEMPKSLGQADVILGNFGDTDKTLRVIANKSYEAIALGKAQISAEAPAMKEFFTDRENILFCKRADPQDLADKIIELKNNPGLKNKLAENGYKIFKEKATPKILAQKLINDLDKIAGSRN